MIDIFIALSVLFALHFVGDFVCQSDRMAKGKSTNWLILLEHVMTYYLVIGVGFILFKWVFYPNMGSLTVFLLVNLVAHFVTDFFTSRWTTKLYLQGKRHWFFVVIGLDQLIHILTLMWTYKLLVLG
jgi:hypothetical protein